MSDLLVSKLGWKMSQSFAILCLWPRNRSNGDESGFDCCDIEIQVACGVEELLKTSLYKCQQRIRTGCIINAATLPVASLPGLQMSVNLRKVC